METSQCESELKDRLQVHVPHSTLEVGTCNTVKPTRTSLATYPGIRRPGGDNRHLS